MKKLNDDSIIDGEFIPATFRVRKFVDKNKMYNWLNLVKPVKLKIEMRQISENKYEYHVFYL